MIQLLDVVEFIEYKTTLVAGLYFFYIVLETLQRSQRALVDLFALSGDTNLAVSLEYAVQHIGTCDGADSGRLEDLTNLRVSDNFLLDRSDPAYPSWPPPHPRWRHK